MRYTLEIQKLLLQTQNDSLHPREKANLLKDFRQIERTTPDPFIFPQQVIFFDYILVILVIIQDFREHGNLFRICRKKIQFIVFAELLSPLVCGMCLDAPV